MERYIFLDIDGVLNTQRYYRQRQELLLPTRDPLGPFFDPESVRHLAHIVAETGVDIVITSSWTYWWKLCHGTKKNGLFCICD